MASRRRTRKSEKRIDPVVAAKRRRWRFFNGKLVKIIKDNKADGLVLLYDSYSGENFIARRVDFVRNSQYAFTKWEAADLLDVHRHVLVEIVYRLNAPKQTAVSIGNVIAPNVRAYWSEDNLYTIRQLLANQWNAPNRRRSKLPLTEEELAARLGRNLGVYIKNEHGDFIPIWRANI